MLTIPLPTLKPRVAPSNTTARAAAPRRAFGVGPARTMHDYTMISAGLVCLATSLINSSRPSPHRIQLTPNPKNYDLVTKLHSTGR
jgi:hypothetical protein